MNIEWATVVTRRALDGRGRAYVVKMMSQGLTLARLVAERLATISPGDCFTFVAPTTSDERLYEFDLGKATHAEPGWEATVKAILSLARETGATRIICESATVRSYDGVDDWPCRTFDFGDELYLNIDTGSVTEEELDRALALVHSMWCCNVFIVKELADVPAHADLIFSSTLRGQ